MRDRVAILGGGVAGMSAAHELVERGFRVEVYEKRNSPGGKARSILAFGEGRGALHEGRVPDDHPAHPTWLPGEHGFRFFPSFYRHVVDTMSRIPFGRGNVADNLVPTSRVRLARSGARPIDLPARSPQTLFDLRVILQDFLALITHETGLPIHEAAYFGERVWQIVTSCEERRADEYERIPWWEYIGAETRSRAYQKFLADGITRSLVAAQAKLASTKTIGDIFVQLLFGMTEATPSTDRVLNGPTNQVWIDPWLRYLVQRGVKYHQEAEVVSIQCEGDRVTGATVRMGSNIRRVEADWFVCAVPVERMLPLVSPRMAQLDPSLAKLSVLRKSVAWMNGIQFFLRRDVPIVHGHAIYVDSAWALTSISQKQFWPAFDLGSYADGSVRGILSVDISNWNDKGQSGKSASESSFSEIAHEVWEDLKRSLNVEGRCLLRDEDLHSWFLDPDIVDDPRAPARKEDTEPLLVNQVNTWALRPEAETRITNLFLASDYVRTYTDLATMEGANEAARRAVNGVIRASGSDAVPCHVWPLHEPELLAPLRDFDRVCYRQGAPWSLSVMGAAAEVVTGTRAIAAAPAEAGHSPGRGRIRIVPR